MVRRVRFAPSPTGNLHIGSARTALFNWLFTRRHDGVLVLRIEDTDRDRSKVEHVESIMHMLRWLNIDWDEGPYYQSEGIDRHRKNALDLLSAGKAYRDFTTPEELAQEREAVKTGKVGHHISRRRAESLAHGEAEEMAENGIPHAIRFYVPEGKTVWEDIVHGEMIFQNEDIDDLVILRGDGSPTYNLAVTSDDAHQNISHVIRGDDHLSNTPKQILIYQAMGWEIPIFGHVPMILGSDGKRLSKRHGATAVREYEEQGILPDAMTNFLALLGWSPGDDKEVMTADELVDLFSIERVLKKSSIFDSKKLDWLSGQHFNIATAQDLESELTAMLVAAELVNLKDLQKRWDWYLSLIDILKTRARRIPDLVDLARPFLLDDIDFDPEAVRKHWLKDPKKVLDSIKILRLRLEGLTWEIDVFEKCIRDYAKEISVGLGQVVQPIRVAVTGRQSSPGIFDVFYLLGKERVLVRLDRAIEFLGELIE